jgi:interleukin enhancer-binding factor 2
MSRPQVFDQFMAETEFPCMPNDDKLANELLCRHQKITPSDQEQASVTALVGRVKSALENISALGTGVLKIDEFREVGSYKKGTMLTRHKVADLVVMVKNLPKRKLSHFVFKNIDINLDEDGVELGNSIVEMLKTTNQTQNDVFGVVPREFGCEIAGTQAVVRLLLTVPSDQLDNLDPNIHCDPSIIIQNLAALRHAHWFDEHSQPTLKILIRLIKDIKLRCTGLASLDIWTIELLSHYCLTCTPTRDPLPLSLAFRRFWQLISSGFLLHTSIGVADPCDQSRRINHGFELAEAVKKSILS